MLNVPTVFDPVLYVTPRCHEFGDVPVGECTASTLVISDRDGCHLHVKDIRFDPSSDPGFSFQELPKLPLTVPSRTSKTLEIRFCPGHGGEAIGTVLIASDDPLRPVLRVAVHGMGV